MLCGECIENKYINKKGIFDKRLHEHEYSKFHQNFYTINKEHQRMIFSKLIKREKSLYSSDDTLNQGLKRSYTTKLSNIEQVFNSLIS